MSNGADEQQRAWHLWRLTVWQSLYDDRAIHQEGYGLEEVIDEKPKMEEIVKVVAEVCRVTKDEIIARKRGRQTKNIARQLAIYGCQRLGMHKQSAIAEHFSLTHRGNVSWAINSVEERITSGDLKNHYGQIRSVLSLTKRT